MRTLGLKDDKDSTDFNSSFTTIISSQLNSSKYSSPRPILLALGVPLLLILRVINHCIPIAQHISLSKTTYIHPLPSLSCRLDMITSVSSSMPYSTSPDSYSHSHINNTDNMVRSSSAEPGKSSKRKGMFTQLLSAARHKKQIHRQQAIDPNHTLTHCNNRHPKCFHSHTFTTCAQASQRPRSSKGYPGANKGAH